MRRLDLFPSNDLIMAYRNTFSTRAGMMVLGHMLFDLGALNETADTPEEIALRNYGTRLQMILAGGEIGEGAIEEYLKRLMMQPLPKEKKED